MKILITTDLYTVDTNGVVTSVKNLQKELEEKGHDVRILTFSGTCHSRREGNVSFIGSQPFPVYPDVRFCMRTRHRFVKELIEWKPDVIHSNCEFFSFQFAQRIARKTGAPIVHTYHTLYEDYVHYLLPGRRFGRWVVRTVSRERLKCVTSIIAPTQKVEGFLRSYGIDNPVHVVPSGIKLEKHRMRITDGERAEGRAAYGIGDDKTVLISLGRVGDEKNIGELIEFFASAARTRSDIVFMIVGDGPAREKLEKQAADLGIADRVIFTGMVPPDKVQHYYQLGDVFVSASTSETQGLTYVEAAANGLPLLCRNDPCLLEVLMQGENGYAYRNKAEFLTYLDVLADHPRERREAGHRSETLSERFDTPAFGNAVEKVYEDAIQQ